MKNSGLSFILLFLISTSCESSNSPDLDLIKEAIQNGISDLAFKGKSEYKIYKLDIINVERVGESAISQSKSVFYNKRYDVFISKTKEFQGYAAEELDLSKNLESIDMPAGSHRIKARDYAYKATAYLDSAKRYSTLDSLVKIQLEIPDKDSSKYYRVKSFIKATVGKENILDTMYFLVDRNYRLLTN